MSLKSLIPKIIHPLLKGKLLRILTISLIKAAKEQGMCGLMVKLEKIVPDISNQFSIGKVDNPYLMIKVRNQHAFQISLVNKVIKEFDRPVIVDIGDSSSTHLQYITGLYFQNKSIRTLSVNLDTKAVEKIKQKGFEAVNARAEDLHKYNINADIFLCFEVLEHLMNPCHFLHELSSKTKARYLIVTVPYLQNSRVRLKHIRNNSEDMVCAENTHIFELNSEDWKLIVRHSGWKVVKEEIYFQYPRKGFLRITRNLWKKCDFEGFFGMILTRDNTWSSRYLDW